MKWLRRCIQMMTSMMTDAYNFFKNKFPDVNTNKITAECLGVSSTAVERYRSGPTEVSVQPQTSKRSKQMTDDLPVTVLPVIFSQFLISCTFCNVSTQQFHKMNNVYTTATQK